MKRKIRVGALGFVILILLGAVGSGLAEDPATANRDNVYRSLRGLAFRAQAYYYADAIDGGGSRNFANLTLPSLTNSPTNAYGLYALVSPSASSVTLYGFGIETGNDGSTPVEVVAIVYADSLTFIMNN